MRQCFSLANNGVRQWYTCALFSHQSMDLKQFFFTTTYYHDIEIEVNS